MSYVLSHCTRDKEFLLNKLAAELLKYSQRSGPIIFTSAKLASAGISCRRVSVCLSVRLSQVGVVLKRLKVESRKQRHTIAQGL